MAIRSVSVSIAYEAGETFWSLSAGSSATNRLELIKGDSLQLNFSDLNNRGITLTASNFSSAYWSTPSNLVIAGSGNGTRTTRSDVSTPLDITVTLSASGGGVSGIRTLFLRIVSGDDVTPDAFELGDNILGARLGSEYLSQTVVVTGITVGVVASVSAGRLIVNGTDYGPSFTVYAGYKVQLALTAPAAYTAAVWGTLTIGGVSDSWTVTTQNDPDSGQIIPFPITALPIKMSDVINFWGGFRPTFAEPSARNMLAYVRGGQYVPNISANANIPTAAPLKWTDFIGGATSFFLLYSPQFKHVAVSTLDGPVSAELTWVVGQDFDVGFGPGMRHNCEYMYSNLVEYTGAMHSQGVTLWSQSNPGVYNSANRMISISASAPRFTERLYEGRLTVYIRLLWDTSKVVSATIHYRIYCFGP